MATPVGHAVAGIFVSGFANPSQTGNRFVLILLCAFVSIMPDLDIIPGFFVGRPAQYHQGITHSLGFAIVVSGVIAGAYKMRGKSFVGIFALFFASYLTHLALDLIGPDSRPPFGIPLFWPLSNATFLSPVPILMGVQHAASTSTPTSEWIQALFSLRNVGAIIIETLVTVPLILIAYLFRRGQLFRRSGALSKGKN